jgi:hypothetical protein
MFVRIRCKQHGDLRTTVTDIPGSYHACPVCSEPMPCAVLGVGGTRQMMVLELDEGFYPRGTNWQDAICASR